MSDWPRRIIVLDEDNGAIVAELDTSKDIQTADEDHVPVYKQIEYYHDLDTAVRDEF
jgi:hypothetical protein